MSSPVFDESVASAAAHLHLVPIAVAALLGTLVLRSFVESRGRKAWAEVPSRAPWEGGGPYRASRVVAETWLRAPRLVRAAAVAGLAFGHVFVPLLVFALTAFPSDGISVPLVPGIAVAVANWWCGYLLFVRLPSAAQAARYTALSSLVMNVGLLSLTVAHLTLVENQRLDGIQHACSSSVTAVAFLFAAASIAYAALLLSTLRSHGRALDFQAEVATPAPATEVAA